MNEKNTNESNKSTSDDLVLAIRNNLYEGAFDNELLQLVNKYEQGYIKESDLTSEEEKKLIDYYTKRNKELDLEISRNKATINKLFEKLEKAYIEAAKLENK